MLEDKLKVYVTSYSEEVTGSNNHVKVEWPDGREVSFLVDCGLFQEKEHNHINSEPLPYNPENIAFAVATHVHTDHIGRFPYLVLNGFKGSIYCSYETNQLLSTVLFESAERLEDDYRKELKRYKASKERIKKLKLSSKGRGRKDKPRHEKCKKLKKAKERIPFPVLIYTKEDIERVIKKVLPKNVYQTFEPCEGIEVTFYPNAHIAGAVLTVCKIYDEAEELYLLFTGDLGLTNPVTNSETHMPKDVAEKIDVVVSESTYGSAEAIRDVDCERRKHMDIISEVHKKKGTIMYMSNALERPLRLGADLRDMQKDSSIKKQMEEFSTYFDTTFGIKCLNKYLKIFGDDYLPERFNIIDRDSREKAIMAEGPKMFICTSPRLRQGSFLNYGERLLEDPNVTLIFVAYVPDDIKNIISLPVGAKIKYKDEKDGADEKEKYITLRCKRYQFGYYSSHVSTEQMDSFLSLFTNASTLLFNHGTHDSKNNYAVRYKMQNNTTHNLLYGRTVLLTKSGIEKYF